MKNTPMMFCGGIFCLYVFSVSTVFASCQVQSATYALKADDRYSLAFRPGKRDSVSTVVARFESKVSGAHADFFMDEGSGYSEAYLYPVAQNAAAGPTANQPEPLELPIFTISDTLAVSAEVLRPTDIAPRFLFVPKLGQTLFYYPERFDAGNARKEVMPLGMFELSHCK